MGIGFYFLFNIATWIEGVGKFIMLKIPIVLND
jgi:hypothetical protein